MQLALRLCLAGMLLASLAPLAPRGDAAWKFFGAPVVLSALALATLVTGSTALALFAGVALAGLLSWWLGRGVLELAVMLVVAAVVLRASAPSTLVVALCGLYVVYAGGFAFITALATQGKARHERREAMRFLVWPYTVGTVLALTVGAITLTAGARRWWTALHAG